MMKAFAKQYFDILTNDLKGLNLTRILDFDSFYQKQILDSYLPYDESIEFQNAIQNAKYRVDIGFGGGFPLLVLAKHLPDIYFYGLEARGKKAEAVKLIAQKLEINNVSPMHQRLEMVLWDQPTCLTFKAVGTINEFLQKVYATAPIKVFFYKGPQFFDLEWDNISKLKNWKIIENREIVIEGIDKRYLIGLSSEGNVPRGTKNLVNFSQLIAY